MPSGITNGFDWNELDELFGPRSLTLAMQRRHTLAALDTSPQRREQDAGILSQRQATCCGIVLQKVGDVAALCARLRAMEVLAEDDAERLQELLDLVEGKQAEELLKVASRAEAGGRPLRALERKLLPLVRLDHARARLRLVRVAASLEAQRENVCQAARAFAAAAQGACESAALKDLVRAAMSLRNYVQRGPEALRSSSPAPRVMDIGSLLSSMKEFKAVDSGTPRVNLLHFFATSLLRMRPDFDSQLQSQLPGLSGLARLSWLGIMDGLAQLRADAAFVASELQGNAAAYGALGSTALGRLAALQASAEAADAAAAEAVGAAEAAVAKLGRYFGVPGAGAGAGGDAAAAAAANTAAGAASKRREPAGLMVLGQLAELLSGFRLACEEVRAQQREDGAADGNLVHRSCGKPPCDGRRATPSPCRATFDPPAAAPVA